MPYRPRKSLNKGHAKYEGGRGNQKLVAQKPPTLSDSNPDETTPAVRSSARGAQLSFFITKAQKAKLRERGYSDDQIAQMKPVEAHKILGLE
jgi:hypothetical protein